MQPSSKNYKAFKKAEMEVSLKATNLLMSLAITAVIGLASFASSLYLITSHETRFNSFSYAASATLHASKAQGEGKPMKYIKNGGKQIYDVSKYAENQTLAESIEDLKSLSIYALIAAFIITAISHIYIRKWVSNYSMKSLFLRGGQLVSPNILEAQLKAIIKKEDPEHRPEDYPRIYVENLPLPYDKETRHFMLSGDTGAGKSNQLMTIIETVRKRKKKAIIYDKSGELVQHFYRPGKDIILNPFDDRCPWWSIFSEGKDIMRLERMAASFMPMPADSDKAHWTEASRTTFSWLFYQIAAKYGKATIDQIFGLLIASETTVEKDALGEDIIVNRKEMDKLLKGTLAEMVVNVDSPQHSSDVISTLVPKIRSLWAMRGLESRAEFSIRDWISKDDDSFLFIRVNDDELESVRPLVTAWLDTALSAVVSLPKSRSREIWAFIDELQSLDKITSLSKIDEVRKFGLRFVLGFTNPARLYATYGKDNAQAMFSMCGTKLIYRLSEPTVAEWASKLMTEEEVITERSSVNVGSNTSSGTSEQREKLALVSTSEIQLLDDFNFYVRMAGNLPTTKITSTYKNWPIIAEPTIVRTLPAPVDYSKFKGLTDNEPEDEMEAFRNKLNNGEVSYASQNEKAPPKKPKSESISSAVNEPPQREHSPTDYYQALAMEQPAEDEDYI
ncbi:MAG: type IV secretion system DNA-binding domain-containing protein [Pseudomonadales bacterium]|nr:type IV secretion system DNA-binding domain-containing protein [Pseudomonadales bacterium]